MSTASRLQTPHRQARSWLASLCMSVLACVAVPAHAAKGPPGLFPPLPLLGAPAVPLQFDIIGFIQEASLDTVGTVCKETIHPKLRGGYLRVNGQLITVPCNTVLQMPATSLTWADLFDTNLFDASVFATNSASAAVPFTGMALRDKVDASKMPAGYPYNGALPSYEVRVQGNIVKGQYIAGLIFISQQSVNAGTGVINCIDYEKAELHLGGVPGSCGSGDTRIRINDPIGRFGKSHGKPGSGADLIEVGYDKRFTADTDNPTVRADTGYPMCIPRKDPFVSTADPSSGFDPLCPQYNRPVAPNCGYLGDPFPPFVQPPVRQICRTFVMAPPPPQAVDCPAPGGKAADCATDPTRQAPFMVGDHVDYAGNLKFDADGPYVSAHTLTAHVGIYTAPGTLPAYVALEGLLQGTGALPLANLPQEATSLVKIEGMTTDPSSYVDLYAVDIHPTTGATSERLLGTSNPSGPPVIGRFRFKPAGGAFLPPTREMRAVSRALCGGAICAVQSATPTYATQATPVTAANGLSIGQYRAPNFDFIFPEPLVVGDPMVSANLQDLSFLYCGSGPLSTMTMEGVSSPPVVSQLDPGPWGAPMLDPVFSGTPGCDTVKPVAAPVVLPKVNSANADVVALNSATFDDNAGRGRLNIVALELLRGTPSLSAQLYIEMSVIRDGKAYPFSSAPQPMTLMQNAPNGATVCPVATPICWVYNATGAINDPLGSGAFVPPDTIKIRSSLGGEAVYDPAPVRIRPLR